MKVAVPLSVICMAAVAVGSVQTAQAQTGRCHSAKEVVREKTWESIRYKFSPKYIEDNKAEFEKAVSDGVDVFFNDCQSNNLSDEQIILQSTLDIAAAPIHKVADTIIRGLGLPALGDKAFHISVKDIQKHGIFGGPNSFFRKPFG